MKRRILILALGAIAFAANAADPRATDDTGFDDPVTVNVDHLQPRLAAEVEKHAALGYKALARYMERTRFVHRLWFDDVTQPRWDREPLQREVVAREFRKHATEYR